MFLKQSVMIVSVLMALGLTSCTTVDKRANSQSNIATVHSDATVISSPDAAIEFSQTEVDMGKTTSDHKQIIGELHFRNIGSKPLRIEKVTGNCQCFSSWSGDIIVMPSQNGMITAVFDKNKISQGTAKHIINIETNDPNNKITKVSFKSNIEPDLAKEVLALRNDIQSLHADITKVLVAIGANTVDPQPAEKQYDVAIGASPILGSAAAPITIVEFIDFQCPYCIREYDKIKELEKQYRDKVKIVFKHYPLEFHKQAKPAHVATEIVRLQGGSEQFWEIHNMIMASPKKLDVDTLRTYIQSLNIDTQKFDEVIADENKMNDLLRFDIAEAQKCGVRGTPTVFINGFQLKDRSINGYKTRIEQILSSINNK